MVSNRIFTLITLLSAKISEILQKLKKFHDFVAILTLLEHCCKTMLYNIYKVSFLCSAVYTRAEEARGSMFNFRGSRPLETRRAAKTQNRDEEPVIPSRGYRQALNSVDGEKNSPPGLEPRTLNLEPSRPNIWDCKCGVVPLWAYEELCYIYNMCSRGGNRMRTPLEFTGRSACYICRDYGG